MAVDKSTDNSINTNSRKTRSRCFICNEYIEDGESTVLYKDRKTHETCFNRLTKGLVREEKAERKQKEAEQKKEKKAKKEEIPVIKVKDALSEEEYQEKKQYYAYLKTLVGEVLAKHYVMTQRYMEQYQYTFVTMRQTLEYVVEILNKSLDEKGNIVGLIPYYYDEAMEFYTELARCDSKNKGKNVKDMYKTNVINISKGKKSKKGDLWEF